MSPMGPKLWEHMEGPSVQMGFMGSVGDGESVHNMEMPREKSPLGVGYQLVHASHVVYEFVGLQ